jgi:hypothetical protein
MILVTAVTAAVTLMLAQLPGAQARSTRLAAHSYLIQQSKIGGFPVLTGGFAQARQLFGGPFSSTQDRFTCVAKWAGGLTLAFKRQFPLSVWEKACRVLEWAQASGKKWQTDKGLRVGNTESQIKHLYPKATSAKAGSTTKWSLVPGQKPVIQAWTKRGSVVLFRIVRA